MGIRMAVLGKSVPVFIDHERFLSKISVSNKDCWVFTGGISASGYGVFSIKDTSFSAHRVSFELFNGIIDPTNVIDHICRNKKCVNPEHLRQVNHRTNTRENNSSPATLNAIKTHCKEGHELSGTNLYAYKGQRHCQTCRTATWKKRLTGQGKGYHNRVKTHCINGHEYSADNIYNKKRKNGKTGRACKLCYTNRRKTKGRILNA